MLLKCGDFHIKLKQLLACNNIEWNNGADRYKNYTPWPQVPLNELGGWQYYAGACLDAEKLRKD